MSDEKTQNSPPEPGENESTRRKILTAALDEFAENGLAGGRVDRIASRASVNKAMIYYHFQSKENLYREAIADIYNDVVKELVNRVDANQPFEELLRDASDAYFSLFLDHPQLRPILLRELAEPDSEILTMIGTIIGRANIPRKLMGRFQEKMADGTIRRLDLKHTIASFLALNIGSIMLIPMMTRILNLSEDDTATFLSQRRAAVVDLFLHGAKVNS